MSRAEHRKLARGVQAILAGIGAVCLIWVGFVTAQATRSDRVLRAQFEDARRQPSSAGATSPGGASEASPRDNDVIGLLEIPRLGFSEVLAEGDGTDTLRIAVGHLPDTPFPWQPGNSAFAGHRDGRFRPLAAIKVGDRIRLETRHGNLDYVLRETMIVSPEDVWVLAPTTTRTLTLITCYPFSYIGKAPKRFVMKAVPAPGAETSVDLAGPESGPVRAVPARGNRQHPQN